MGSAAQMQRSIGTSTGFLPRQFLSVIAVRVRRDAIIDCSPSLHFFGTVFALRMHACICGERADDDDGDEGAEVPLLRPSVRPSVPPLRVAFQIPIPSPLSPSPVYLSLSPAVAAHLTDQSESESD